MRPAPEIERWLTEWLAAAMACPPERVAPTHSFARLGMASVDLVGMTAALEDWLEEPVDEAVCYRWPTPRALAEGLAGGPSAAAPILESTVDELAADPVVVVGMSCRFPGDADDPELFWRNLIRGVDAVSDVPADRWDVDRYYHPDPGVPGRSYTRRGAFLRDAAGWDARFFAASPQEAVRTDPQQRLLMELVWEALEDAALDPAALRGSRTGVAVGLMDTGQYALLQREAQGDACDADPYFGTGGASSVAAGRIAHLLDLRGPAFTIDTACSSSLVAVHLAAQSLLRGETDLAVAGGAALTVHPAFHVQACGMSMLAPDGRCKTFDEAADGFAMGEGGGVVVLERLSNALRHGHRVQAVLLGSAVNQDGATNGLTAPNRDAQVEVIRAALAAAGTAPDDIGYVEAHGSGTRLGDAVELSALHEVFGGRSVSLRVGAVKTAVGHTLAAAGMAGLVKTIMAVRHGHLPPNLHLARPSAAIPADGTVLPVSEPMPFPTTARGRVAGVSSFGWSGTNAHLVVAQAPAGPAAAPGRPWQVLTLSAATPTALARQASGLAEALRGQPDLDLADAANTTQIGRARLATRAAVVCRDTEDAVDRLTDLAREAHTVAPAERDDRPGVAFLLPGVGDQHPGTGRELYETEPVFARAFDECADLVAELSTVDLRACLLAEADNSPGLLRIPGRTGAAVSEVDSEVERTGVAHPLVFAVEIATARLLASRGVHPDAMIGYSLGEYTAACLAGVFSLPDAVRVVVRRAQLIAATPPGAMMAVAADVAEVAALLTDLEQAPAVAAVNGPAMTVLAGPDAHVAAARRVLADHGVAHQPLRTTHAFHTLALAPVRAELRAVIAAVERGPLQVPVASNLTGTWLTDDQAADPDYWAEHLCRPVRFADGLRALADTRAFVEVGPGATLGALARQNSVVGPDAAVLATLPSPLAGTGERRAVLTALGRLWELGADVDWPGTHQGPRRRVALPTYPFERDRYWPERTDQRPIPAQGGGTNGQWCYAPRWLRDTAVPTGAASDTPLLVLADPRGIGAKLAELVRAQGTRVVEVRPGAGHEHRPDGAVVTIDPTRPEHYRAAVDRVLAGQRGPLRVVHTWSLRTPPMAQGPEQALRTAVDDGFHTLRLLLQALGEQATDVHLLTVTSGGADVLGTDLVAPERTIVHGLGRVVPAEHPGWRWSGVDLDALDRPDEQARQLLTELTADPGAEPLSAWRQGHRWVQHWHPVRPGDTAEDWDADGAYLITGGTRGLGMAVAKHLARLGVRRLALVARTPRADLDDRTRDDVRALEDRGAEVLLLTADAGVPERLRAAVRAAHARFGPLTGVVHCAGVPGEGVLQRKTRERADAVLAPKVLGVAPLLELVRDERVGRLVLFSSSVSALGGLGEGDYCAANTVLDACAGWAGAAGRVVSVAWGPWRHDAWQSTALATLPGLADAARRYRAEFGIGDEVGPALLGRLLAGQERQVLVLGQPLADTRAFWATLSDPAALTEGITPAGAGHARPRLRTAFVAPRTELETRVAAVWERFLGIDGIGVNDPFFDLGGNSLVGTAVVRVLETELDVSVAPAVLFQHPTVAELAHRLTEGARPARAGQVGRDRGEHRRSLRSGRRTVLVDRQDVRKRGAK